MVGGCVRDALLGVRSNDFDLEVFGLSKERLERCLTEHFGRIFFAGKAFGVFKLSDFPFVDIALPRLEEQTGPKHVDFCIKSNPFLTFKEAAERRDFTINAMGWDLLEARLYDPYKGYDDLIGGLLRHTSKKFIEDPLRVLRGMQLMGRFQLTAAEETLQLCRTLSPLHLSRERIFGEFKKLFEKSQVPSLGLVFLKEVRWLTYFPELQMLAEEQPLIWPKILRILDALAPDRLTWQLGLSVLGYWIECFWGCADKFLQSLCPRAKETRACLAWIHGLRTLLSCLKQSNHRFIETVYERRAALRGIVALLEALLLEDGSGVDLNQLRLRLKCLNLYPCIPEPIVNGKLALHYGLKEGEALSLFLRSCFVAQIEGKIFDKVSAEKFIKTEKHRFFE